MPFRPYCYVDHTNKLATTGFKDKDALCRYRDAIRFDKGTICLMQDRYLGIFGTYEME